MSIRIHATYPARTSLRIAYDEGDTDLLNMSVEFYDIKLGCTSAVRIDIPTKDLIMAIKQVEEERDERLRPDERSSKAKGIRESKSTFTIALRARARDLRTDLRRSSHIRLSSETIDALVRDFLASKDLKEARDTLERIEKTYLGSDSTEVRHKSF